MGGTERSSVDTEPADVPRTFASVPPPVTTPMLDHSFTLQAIMGLERSVADLAAKTDRLIKDVASQNTKLNEVYDKITFVRGALWVIGALMISLIGIVTWYFTGKISITIR